MSPYCMLKILRMSGDAFFPVENPEGSRSVLRAPHPFPVNQFWLFVIAFIAISMACNSFSVSNINTTAATFVAAQLWTGISILLLRSNGRFFRLFYLGSLIYCIGLVIAFPRAFLLFGFPHGLLLLAYACGRGKLGKRQRGQHFS